MKKIILVFVAAFLLIGFSSFRNLPSTFFNNVAQSQQNNFQVPDDVQKILDNYCLQCHGTEGSGKAKFKWNFDKMSGLKTSKFLSKLAKISDEVKEEEMPPKKYIKKHPEKVMSAEEKQSIVDWADRLAESLIAN